MPRCSRFVRLTLVPLLLALTTPLLPPPTPWGSALAQTTSGSSEGQKRIDACREQAKAGQYQAALQSCQQAIAAFQQANDRASEVRARVNAGIVLNALNQPAEAAPMLQRALELSRQGNDREVELKALYNLALAQGLLKQYPEAIATIAQLTQAARQQGNTEIEVAGLTMQAILHNTANQPAEARQRFQEATIRAQSVTDRAARLDLYTSLCKATLSFQAIAEARISCQQGLALAQELKNKELTDQFQQAIQTIPQAGDSKTPAAGDDKILSLLQQGDQQFNESQFTASMNSYQQAAALYRAANRLPEEAKLRLLIADRYRLLGEPAKAIETLQRVVAIAETTKNPELKKTAETQIAAVRQDLANPRKVAADTNLYLARQAVENNDLRDLLNLSQEALELYQAIGDLRGQQIALALQVLAYRQTVDLEKLEAVLQRLLKVAEALGDMGVIAWSKTSLVEVQTARTQLQANPKELEAYQQLQQGRQQFEASQYTAALESFQQALKRYQDLKKPDGEAKALALIGFTYFDLGDTAKAQEFLQRSLTLARTIKDTSTEALVVQQLDFIKNQQANPRKAEADRLMQQASRLLTATDLPGAVQAAQQALELYRSIKNREGEAAALITIGIIQGLVGDQNQSEQLFQEAGAIVRELKQPTLELQIQRAREIVQTMQQDPVRLQLMRAAYEGSRYFNTSNYSAAQTSFEQALSLSRKLNDRYWEARSLSLLGILYRVLGDVPRGTDYYQQGIALARKIQDDRLVATIEEAWQGLQKQSTDPRKAEANALLEQSEQHYQQGRLALALETAERVLKLSQSTGDRVVEAGALYTLGRIYGEGLGDREQAEKQFRQVLKVLPDSSEELTQLIKGNTLGYLGLLSAEDGNYEEAKKFLQQALTLARSRKNMSQEAGILGALSYTALSQGNYQSAIDQMQQALKLFADSKEDDVTRKAEMLGFLGIAYYSAGNATKAAEYLQQKLSISRDANDRDQEAQALYALGYLQAKQGRYADAEQPLRTAIQLLESLRQGLRDPDTVNILNTQQTAYQILEWVLASQNKPEEALELAERGRARAFVELLTKRLSQSTSAASTAQPTATTEQLIVQAPRIEQIRQIAKTQNATLVTYSIVTDELTEFKLRPSQVRLHIWVVKPTGEVVFRQIADERITQLQTTIAASSGGNFRGSDRSRSMGTVVANSLRSIGVFAKSDGPSASGTGDGKQTLRQLHKLLIEPIAQDLPKDPNQHVIFIPQGALFLVPFPALIDASGKYLIEHHTLLTAPSIQVLELTHQQRQRLGNASSGSTLIVGNPVMPKIALEPGGTPEPLAPLPGAEQEARAIAQLLKTSALLGPQATESVVVQQMQQARRIHLATHGLLDERQGLGSAIALTPGGKDDGLLTAEEILNLKLQAELVVLSACDTGRGRITGDGVVGLSRSLISAGVPSVVVSLWAVPDAPTASLMTQFYQNLQKTPDKAQALRQAMLSTMQQYPNPRNWAAFTLIGEAE